LALLGLLPEAAGARRDPVDADDPVDEDPGVTTHSGSSVPSGTISCTVAIVVFAAIAITGPKLRAVMRYVRLPQRSPRSALMNATSACSGVSKTYMRPSISRVSLPLASSVP
jgi:hypothetical protein